MKLKARATVIISSMICLLAGMTLIGLGLSRAAAATATLSITPSGATVALNTNFTIDVMLDTGGASISAVDAQMPFSSNLQFVSANTTGSVFDTTLKDPVVSSNTVSFARIRIDKGFTGTAGKVISLTFKATSNGTGSLSFANTTQVITFSDSTNVLKQVVNGSYTLGTGSSNNGAPSISNLGPSGLTTGKTISTTSPGPFTGTVTPGNSQYVLGQFQIAKDKNFADIKIDYVTAHIQGTGTRSFTVGQQPETGGGYITGSAATRLDNGTYYWRMLAHDTNGTPSFANGSYWLTANNGATAFIIDTTSRSVEPPATASGGSSSSSSSSSSSTSSNGSSTNATTPTNSGSSSSTSSTSSNSSSGSSSSTSTQSGTLAPATPIKTTLKPTTPKTTTTQASTNGTQSATTAPATDHSEHTAHGTTSTTEPTVALPAGVGMDMDMDDPTAQGRADKPAVGEVLIVAAFVIGGLLMATFSLIALVRTLRQTPTA